LAYALQITGLRPSETVKLTINRSRNMNETEKNGNLKSSSSRLDEKDIVSIKPDITSQDRNNMSGIGQQSFQTGTQDRDTRLRGHGIINENDENKDTNQTETSHRFPDDRDMELLDRDSA
jgi:hypothetical protein